MMILTAKYSFMEMDKKYNMQNVFILFITNSLWKDCIPIYSQFRGDISVIS